MFKTPPVMVVAPVKVFAPLSTHVPAPLLLIATEVAPPLEIKPLTVLALVLLPARVSTVAPTAPPVIPPVIFRVPVPAPVPLALWLARVKVPPAPSMTRGAAMVSTASAEERLAKI